MIRLLRTLALASAAAASLAGAAGASSDTAAGGTRLSCPGQSLSRPFLPWLDPASYVLLQNGSLESTSGWKLSKGARLVADNEPFHVNSAQDRFSLSLPAKSSATSPPLCVTLLHPDLRFFAVNTGSPLSLLRVEVVTTLAGLNLTTPVGVLVSNGSWQPTLPLPFLTNLVSPLAGSVRFRFTPLGASSGWRIDDVYVDPYKSG